MNKAETAAKHGDEQVKIADFGLARDEEYTASETSKYPVRWASPEVLSMRLFSSKADVWSFGVMITEEMTYGMKPYPSMNIEKVLFYGKTRYTWDFINTPISGIFSCEREKYHGST